MYLNFALEKPVNQVKNSKKTPNFLNLCTLILVIELNIKTKQC